jgi:NitT/TauT family transport system substrate-binding protein
MQLFDESNGLDLQIHPGGPSINTVTLVASGQNTFGTLAADEVLLANEKGADLVIVGVINDISPGGFVSLAASGIKSPKDFPGHTVGVLPFGSTTLLYEAMLAANGVDRSRIRERTISPDLRPFIQGAYDVHPVFVYDETVTLDQLGVRYNLIEPKDFGVQVKGPVYFTSRKTVVEHPEVVRAFVRTMVQGWRYALANRDDAIRRLHAFAPDIDPSRERRVLEKGANYFQAYRGQPVNSDPASWPPSVNRLVELGKLDSVPNLKRVVRLDWVREFYSAPQSRAK